MACLTLAPRALQAPSIRPESTVWSAPQVSAQNTNLHFHKLAQILILFHCQGFYCPDRVNPVECASGTFSYAGSTAAGQCESCPAGYKCPSTSATPTKCEEGYYSAAGTPDCRTCKAGFYCPSPATETAVTGGGKYYAPAGSTFQRVVPHGYGFVSTSIEPIKCGAGTWWRSSDATCVQCTAGQFCPIDSTTGLVGNVALTVPTGFYTD